MAPMPSESPSSLGLQSLVWSSFVPSILVLMLPLRHVEVSRKGQDVRVRYDTDLAREGVPDVDREAAVGR